MKIKYDLEFSKSKSENFSARLAQGNLTSKSDIFNFETKTNFDDSEKKLKQYQKNN